ncbi:protein PLASTID REDOX INSENSITIVE 2, chloroplastic-like [Diospyros lotus]|uniref:protein PLASTID REDOX INSENSITIVE 2, chloroplastic-like n=1 Tax=Diospyros lotus TaxID=55363 RepID=UPI00224DCD89|nr:protein PLASTID REDOX INSENSITIVE 2, chloroplastic-like [Diospyros lotus]
MASAVSMFPVTIKSSSPSSSPFNPSLSHFCGSFPSSSYSSSKSICWVSPYTSSSDGAHCRNGVRFKHSRVISLSGNKRLSLHPSPRRSSSRLSFRAAAEYKFPDPIPEFADAETEKFRNHLIKKLSKKDMFGDSLEEVVGICTEILSTFLHTEYGGPGTLLVIPFIDMADTLNERGLPGGPQAARAAVKWAQDHVDKDWKEWNSGDSS